MRDQWILGISCSHNGSAALMKNGEFVVAIQEERLTRQKRQQVYGSQPILSVQYCLDYAGISVVDLGMIIVCTPRYAGDPVDDVSLNPVLRPLKNKIPFEIVPHHLGHGIGSFVLSGFDEAGVLVIDGIGSPYQDLLDSEKKVVVEMVNNGWETISMYKMNRKAIIPVEKHLIAEGNWISTHVTEMKTFGSLGGMFSSAAAQIFGDVLEAGKVMGLAPYGKPVYPVEEFFTIENNKFNYTSNIVNHFQTSAKWPSNQEEYQNLSASVQNALESALSYLVPRLQKLAGTENFCYTGGVALNSVANDKFIHEFKIKNVFIQPEAEDSGTAIGAVLYGYWKLNGEFPVVKQLKADHRGKIYPCSDIEAAIKKTPGIEIYIERDIVAETVELLCQGKIIGLYSGGSELGPRALGHRSILCDPRMPDAKEILNKKVKHREAFRPFAPAILQEEVNQWFETDRADFESPFMLRVCNFKKDKLDKLPAVTHVDGTGRVQTVTRDTDELYYDLINAFFQKTGVPVLVNTSFNIMGEPIVETPEDALWCLLGTDIDYVVFERQMIVKKKASYSSILDLVPYLTVKRYNIHNLIENDIITDVSAMKYSFVSYVMDTRWGETTNITGVTLLPLLKLIDGKLTGKEILKLLPVEQNIKELDYIDTILKWEAHFFGESDQTQDYVHNSSVLVDHITYPRMIASVIAGDQKPVINETDFNRLLLRLKRAGIISFR